MRIKFEKLTAYIKLNLDQLKGKTLLPLWRAKTEEELRGGEPKCCRAVELRLDKMGRSCRELKLQEEGTETAVCSSSEGGGAVLLQTVKKRRRSSAEGGGRRAAFVLLILG